MSKIKFNLAEDATISIRNNVVVIDGAIEGTITVTKEVVVDGTELTVSFDGEIAFLNSSELTFGANK